jgi:AcrR family transcriptional regulator
MSDRSLIKLGGFMARKATHSADAILWAAADCFAQEGFAATSTDTIARYAGISSGLLYRYFPSKQALITALITAYDDWLLLRLQNPPATALEDWLDRLWLWPIDEHLQRDCLLLSDMAIYIARHPELVAAQQASSERLYEQVLADLKQLLPEISDPTELSWKANALLLLLEGLVGRLAQPLTPEACLEQEQQARFLSLRILGCNHV